MYSGPILFPPPIVPDSDETTHGDLKGMKERLAKLERRVDSLEEGPRQPRKIFHSHDYSDVAWLIFVSGVVYFFFVR